MRKRKKGYDVFYKLYFENQGQRDAIRDLWASFRNMVNERILELIEHIIHYEERSPFHWDKCNDSERERLDL